MYIQHTMLRAVSRSLLNTRLLPRATPIPVISVQARLFAARSASTSGSIARKSRTSDSTKKATKTAKTAKKTDKKAAPAKSKASRPWERFDSSGKLIPLPYDTKPTRKHPFMLFVMHFSKDNINRPEYRCTNAQGESKAVVTSLIHSASAEWRGLSDAERKPYLEEAARLAEKYEHDLAAWRSSLTPDDIKRQNQYLMHRRKQGLSSRALLKDVNAPRRPLNSFARFMTEVRLESQYQGMPLKSALPLIGERWRSLPAEAKRPYEEAAREEKVQYARDLDKYRAETNS